MNRVNLLPSWRRRRLRARARARGWGGVLTAWCGMLVLVSGAIGSLEARPDAAAARRLEAARGRVAQEQAEWVATNEELAGVRKRLVQARAVADHPDWSRLLALLAEVRGEETMLESLELVRIETAAAQAATGPQATAAPAGGAVTVQVVARVRERYGLKLAGLARSAGAVTRLVLALEDSRVFASVRLIETKPAGLGEAGASAFRIECELAEREEPVVNGPAKKERGR